MQINIAIADDQHLFRMGMVAVLNSLENIKVGLQCTNGKVLLTELATATEKPTMIILDLVMPELDGIATLKLIRQEYPTIPVLMLSSHEDQDAVFSALKAGANGYLSKNAQAEEVEQAISDVLKEGFYLKIPKANLSHLKAIDETSVNSDWSTALISKREKEILSLICQQYTNSEIASKLSISERTVEGHRNHLLNKTDSKNAIGLLVFALKHRLVSLAEIFNEAG